MHAVRPTRVFYGWWIVLAAFLNLFFSVGIIYYGFPVFYPSLVSSLGFTRAQLILGFLLGFLVAAAVLGFLAGAMIDRWGVRPVLLALGLCCLTAAGALLAAFGLPRAQAERS